MSVLSYYEGLWEKAYSLDKELSSCKDDLQRAQTDEKVFKNRLRDLEGKKSLQAKNTAEKLEDSLKTVSERIPKLKKKIAKLEEESKKTRGKAYELAENPTLHIREQATKMAKSLWSHIRKMTPEERIKFSYEIHGCDPLEIGYTGPFKYDNYYGYYIQPNPVSIVSKRILFYGETLMTSEVDRYFALSYTGYLVSKDVNEDENGIRSFKTVMTEWYQKYLKEFYKTLKFQLVSKNPFKDTYELKFDDSAMSFELDLV